MEQMSKIKDHIKAQKKLDYYLKSAWYFQSAFDKIILIVLGVLGVWKLVELIFKII